MIRAVKSIECRHVVHVPAPEPGMDDLHLVKKTINYDDGTSSPDVEIKTNYKRPFWVTKKGARNHNSKKEFEHVQNVNRFECVQTPFSFQMSVAAALGKPGTKGDVKQLADSPFLYGVDMKSTALIKQAIMEAYPVPMSNYSICSVDVETDMLNDSKEILMCTLSMKSMCYTIVLRSFVDGITHFETRLEEVRNKYFGPGSKLEKFIKPRNINFEVIIVDTPMEIVSLIAKRLHEIQPDFLIAWNMLYEIERFMETCSKYGVDIADIFSDPKIPKTHRFFKLKKGQQQKVTASGKESPIKPAAQWHTVFCPSSFYWIDPMCVYRQLRIAKQEQPSYSLDFTLEDELGITKLKVDEVETTDGAEWHRIMQSKYKLDYIVYNMFDCISMELLDEKTLDVKYKFPMQLQFNDFIDFNSQPKREWSNLYFELLNNNKVPGCTSRNMKEPEDQETMSPKGWIVALQSNLIVSRGIPIFYDIPYNIQYTKLFPFSGDLDVAAAYPRNQVVANISKRTTSKEVIRIEGIDQHTQRMQTLNLSSGSVNSIEFATTMYGFPKVDEVLTYFDLVKSQTVNV